MPALTDTQDLIGEVCDEVKAFLQAKNREYGNSAFEPMGIFSGLDAITLINVRIDDKLARIRAMRNLKGAAIYHEDTELDLMGYLVLKRAAQKLLAVKPTRG